MPTVYFWDVFSISTDRFPVFAAGQHLHCGLRRRLSRDHARPYFCLHLHCFWNHPQWPAHIYPLQQVLRLLLQTQVQPVHRLPEEPREGEIWQEDGENPGTLLWKPPMSCTLIVSSLQNKLICFTVKLEQGQKKRKERNHSAYWSETLQLVGSFCEGSIWLSTPSRLVSY